MFDHWTQYFHNLLTLMCSSFWLKLLTSLILFIAYTLLCLMFLFSTLNDWCCKHFVVITSALLCLINKCFFLIFNWFFFFHIYVSQQYQWVFNIVATMTVGCLCSIIITCHKYSLSNMYPGLLLMVRFCWESWPSVAVKPWYTLWRSYVDVWLCLYIVLKGLSK